MSKPSTVDDALCARVWRFLQAYGSIGLKRRQLRLLLDNVSDRKMRRAVEVLIKVHHKPIGTSQRGYYIIEDSADLAEATRDLRSRARELLQRADALDENFATIHGRETQGMLV